MSQATLQIPAKPTGLDMRTQINAIVLSIITQNSGGAAPAATYPGMWWGDTSAMRLRRRNNADSAWIDVGPLDDMLGDLRAQIAAAASAASAAVPTGTILQFAASAAPTGFLLCNGAAVSRVGYAALFALIGGTYGAGDGSSTFNLPDLRGVVPRGVDAGRGLDAGRALGSYQDDTFGWHGHGVSDPGHGHGVADTGHAHSTPVPYKPYAGSGGNPPAMQDGAAQISGYSNIVSSYSGAGIGIYGSTTGISIGGAGGNETRMKNIAVNFIIKT